MNKRHQAFLFASGLHYNQKRKYTSMPYQEHLREVADLIALHCPDDVTEAAAYLHDSVEDQNIDEFTLQLLFGNEVARIVMEVTDQYPKQGTRAERKAANVERMSKASVKARNVKLADIISNVKDIVEHDPEFAKVYIPEKEAMLQVLTKGNKSLYDLAVQTVNNAKQQLEE
jgi:GTP diphosphokinase / guanosine-3',5'-bis(diphosphate) 3'-diphosphatase